MRVLQIANSAGLTSGGAERLAHDLHLDLLAAGVDAHLLAVEACPLDHVAQAQVLGFGSSYDPRVPSALARAIKRLQPDLIHAHLFPTSLHLALLKAVKAIRIPLVFTEHATSNRRRTSHVGRIIDPKIYSRFDQVFCISEGTRDALIRAYPHLAGKTPVIENGATLSFEVMPKRQRGQPAQLLAMGRLHRAKNHEALLNALSGLRNGTAELTVLGDGPLRDVIEAQASGLDIPVHFKGHVVDPTPYLRAADIFLIPSLWEGFGLAAVEAMNAGLPVIASDVSGLREVVGVDGACALLIDPHDSETIRHATLELINDPERAHQLGRNGFERAKLFDKSQMAQRYKQAYEAVIGGT